MILVSYVIISKNVIRDLKIFFVMYSFWLDSFVMEIKVMFIECEVYG